MTQNNLGAALQDQGIRTEGAEGRRLLADAVTTYRQALEVRTRTELPQDWAGTQNNLGNALADQGTRTEGAEGRRLLAEAVTAYRQALEVRTFEALAPDWAGTHNNLASAYVALEDWSSAAASYANVLRVYPDYAKAYQTANSIYHEKLFAFSEAFALNQQWLARHPNDVSAQMNFVEAHFTTGRFTEAQARLAALLTTADLDARVRIALQTLEIATLLALNKPDSIPGKVEVMRTAVASQPEDFKLDWTFDGTKHFITQNESLAPYREWLLGLIAAVGEKDRNTILAALDTTRANFLAAVKN
jgi:tetratricopeptide (TPR) repeat protein